MSELLGSLSGYQITMIAAAALLIISIFWDKIKGLLPRFRPNTKPKPVTIPSGHGHSSSSLVEVVAYWENLKKSCEERNLSQACCEIDKIFPLLVIEDAEVNNVEV